MYKYERRMNRKNEKRRQFKAVAYVVIITFLFCISFIMSSMIFKKTNVKVKAISAKSSKTVTSLNNSKAGASEKVKSTDSRETNVPDNPAIGTENVNPYKNDGQKIAYLTFDDGPSAEVTPKILDLLDSYDVKATFFVIGYMADKNKDILLREWNDGQSIGNHSYSHNYTELYSTTSNFINDINKCNSEIKSIIGNGYDSKLIRFPGGSFGAKLKPYRTAATEDGYHFVDWNALNGDAESNNVSEDKLLENLKNTTKGKEHIIILMHDASTKETTVQALPEIIDYLKGQGYTFKTLH